MEEAKTKQCYFIAIKDGSFEEVNGTNLDNGFFAYRRESPLTKWVITDKASGAALKSRFPSLAACKEYMKNISQEDLDLIAQKRSAPDYKEQCQKLNNYILKLEGGIDFTEAFDILYKIGGEQIS